MSRKKSLIVIGTFYFNGALNNLFNATGHVPVFLIPLLFPENQCLKKKLLVMPTSAFRAYVHVNTTHLLATDTPPQLIDHAIFN